MLYALYFPIDECRDHQSTQNNHHSTNYYYYNILLSKIYYYYYYFAVWRNVKHTCSPIMQKWTVCLSVCLLHMSKKITFFKLTKFPVHVYLWPPIDPSLTTMHYFIIMYFRFCWWRNDYAIMAKAWAVWKCCMFKGLSVTSKQHRSTSVMFTSLTAKLPSRLVMRELRTGDEVCSLWLPGWFICVCVCVCVCVIESDSCMRQCCGPQRGFTMHITDNFGQVSRHDPFTCDIAMFVWSRL